MLINPCPADIYLFRVNNGNARTMFQICSDFTHCIGIFIVDFELVSAGWGIIMKI